MPTPRVFPLLLLLRFFSVLLVFTAVELPRGARAQAVGGGACIPKKGTVVWRWSNNQTWGGKLPAPNSKVLIPCGVAILFDLPGTGKTPLVLDEIRVMGHLRFSDDVRTGDIDIHVNNVLVEGLITIGSEAQHFQRKLRFLLRNGAPQVNTSTGVNVGRKGFVIFGGRADIHGMPGGNSTPAWVSLSRNADAGANLLVVNQNVSRWPQGGRIVVAPSNAGYDRNRPGALFWDEATIALPGVNTIGLSGKLTYKHWGNPLGVPGKPGLFYSESAEVGLLTRNVVIEGEVEGSFGGHFAIMRTTNPSMVEGVEFVNLGQQGTLGRYPGHWHFAQGEGSYFRKNAIHRSNQRCVVVHATHNLLVESNVAYDVKGHCFMTEDGIEVGTKFFYNLAMKGAPVDTIILQADFKNSDNDPSGFWMPATRQRWLGNHAVGFPSGFWIEAANKVHGDSTNLPVSKGLRPGKFIMTQFDKNVAHGNRDGFKTYPQGYSPNGTTFVRSAILYKNSVHGAFVHDTLSPGRVWFDRCVFADNKFGLNVAPFGIVDAKRNGVAVSNSFFIGDSGTVGLPNAWEDPHNTVPIGIKFDITNNLDANTVVNNYFAGFKGGKRSPDSPPDALPHAINFLKGKAVRKTNPNWWQLPNYFINVNLGNFIKGATYEPGTRMFYVPQSASRNFAYLDGDGSFVGAKGFLLGMAPGLLPPAPYKCRLNTLSAAYLCPGVCYRSVILDVPGASGVQATTYNKPVLKVTRILDNVTQPVYFDNFSPNTPKGRHAFNLFASPMTTNTMTIYSVTPPRGPATIAGQIVNVRYEDLGIAKIDWPSYIDQPSFLPWGPDTTCTAARIRLRFLPQLGHHWVIVGKPRIAAACASKAFGTHPIATHVYRSICSKGSNILEVALGHSPLHITLAVGAGCPRFVPRKC